MVTRTPDTRKRGTRSQQFWRASTRPKPSPAELSRLAYRLGCKPEAARRAIELGLLGN